MIRNFALKDALLFMCCDVIMLNLATLAHNHAEKRLRLWGYP